MTYKILNLYPEEHTLLKSVDLSALTCFVQSIVLPPNREEKHPPLKLKIPDELKKAIGHVTKLKTRRIDHKYLYVLLTAARHYRAKYPIPEGWKEPDNDAYAQAERERRQQEETGLNRKKIVLQLPPEERELLLNLGRGRQDIITRHEALRELASIVKHLDDAGAFEVIKKHNRKSCRINMPDDLEAEITRRISVSGEPFQTILLAAARLSCYRVPD